MPRTLGEALDEIKRVIDESIGASEAQLAATAEQLRALLSELDEQRTQVQGAVEERALDRMLHGDRARRGGLGTGELRRREDQLSQDYTRVSTLYRQLNDFSNLLTASRQQLRNEEQLPGVDDAQRLTIRQAMIRAQEDERRRLAREIHDGPAQVLANAIIGLEFVERSLRQTLPPDRQQPVGEIERVKSAMREGLTEIRRFIFDLRPTMLSQRGLAATVEHYVETYRHFFSSEVELSLPAKMPRLTPDQEMTAFRVIQESLQNVHRHARSSKVQVSMTVTPEGLVVRVRDNGQGFRPADVRASLRGGFGIAGMRERAEVIGARLTVRSAPRKGTDVMLVIPISAPSIEPIVEDAHEVDAHTEGDCQT